MIRLPGRLRSWLRRAHRAFVFSRAMRRLLEDPAACTNPESRILGALVYGWGNEGWSAHSEYLAACLDHALAVDGPILECGSGLSTVVVAAIAKKRNTEYWVLEHTPEWAAKVQASLTRYRLNSVHLCTTTLEDYGAFSWYDPPLEVMPENFALVICDGPPGSTKGGRYGLLPIMGDRLGRDCVILLDDAARAEELDIAKRWQAELAASFDVLGSEKPYIRMTVTGAPDSVSHGPRL